MNRAPSPFPSVDRDHAPSDARSSARTETQVEYMANMASGPFAKTQKKGSRGPTPDAAGVAVALDALVADAAFGAGEAAAGAAEALAAVPA